MIAIITSKNPLINRRSKYALYLLPMLRLPSLPPFTIFLLHLFYCYFLPPLPQFQYLPLHSRIIYFIPSDLFPSLRMIVIDLIYLLHFLLLSHCTLLRPSLFLLTHLYLELVVLYMRFLIPSRPSFLLPQCIPHLHPQ